ncbi:MAG: sulfatase-like hydrolase/transferase [Candidatus Cyclobacteriaceae bacterium M3_2C_046]
MRKLYLVTSLIAIISLNAFAQNQQNELPPPNIIWISWEDVSPNLGAYGDDYAHTPHMDQLAREGITYLNAYSNYPVCAPARATIITGQYASAFGGQFMRVRSTPSAEVRLFPELLRQAGYYCTNDAKTDYQMISDNDITWDESGRGARWQGRKPNQPFFSVINFGTTHEGHSRSQNTSWVAQINQALAGRRHDPDLAPVPPYLPDTRQVRENIALYYDNLTYTDSTSNLILEQLEREGLAENTIIMMWGDHGWGLSRGKRWPYQSGLKVPLIIKIPEKYQQAILASRGYKPGDQVEELVSFVDFAPTMLSLAGIEIPGYMQGQAFLGPQAAAPRSYVYGGRGRMDETYECMRTVINQDFLYLRNYMWHLPYAQTVRSMETQLIMQDWRRKNLEGNLNQEQQLFFQYPKPVEELYDLKQDPHQVNNLVEKPGYKEILNQFRQANQDWLVRIQDVGLITEPELDLIRWADGEWKSTEEPLFTPQDRYYWNGDREVEIGCPTPGASLAWKYQHQDGWQLYTQPVVVGPGQVLQAKAQRLGYYPSKITSFQVSDPGHQPVPLNKQENWQEKVRQHQMVQKLVDFKQLDLKGKQALDDYYHHLDDPLNPIRYWSVVGIRALSETKKEQEKARNTFYLLINDRSPLVQIEAAYGLCQLGDFQAGMPVMKQALQHPMESVRLYALNQLDKMGKKAEMALPFPPIPLGTANHYTHRIMIRIYKRLGITPRDLDYASPAQVQDIQRIYNSIILDNLWDYGWGN